MAYHGMSCPDILAKATESQVILWQNIAEVVNSISVYSSTSSSRTGLDGSMSRGLFPQILKEVTCMDFEEELMNIGDRIFTMKRSYITKIGRTGKDDRLLVQFSEIPRVVGRSAYRSC